MLDYWKVLNIIKIIIKLKKKTCHVLRLIFETLSVTLKSNTSFIGRCQPSIKIEDQL
jgi:hypothetical protein